MLSILIGPRLTLKVMPVSSQYKQYTSQLTIITNSMYCLYFALLQKNEFSRSTISDDISQCYWLKMQEFFFRSCSFVSCVHFNCVYFCSRCQGAHRKDPLADNTVIHTGINNSFHTSSAECRQTSQENESPKLKANAFKRISRCSVKNPFKQFAKNLYLAFEHLFI